MLNVRPSFQQQNESHPPKKIFYDIFFVSIFIFDMYDFFKTYLIKSICWIHVIFMLNYTKSILIDLFHS